MKQLQIILLLFSVTLLVSCGPAEPKAKAPKIIEAKTTEAPLVGLWKLHLMEKQDSATGQWNEWRDGMQGYILYDDQDHMSLHLTTKGYEKTDLRFPNFIDTIPEEALKHLTHSYVYFAKYTIDYEKHIVEHARISHSNPGMWNEVVQRRFSFIGDTLVFQPVEQSLSGLRLKWLKQD